MSIDFNAITAASAVPVTAGMTAGGAKQDAAVGTQDYFLKLLVAQMNNQDPLNPMDSAQMTSQLAQLNTVQGINKLSTQLDTLLGDVNAAQSLQASSLVGHGVLVPGTTVALASGNAVGGVDLDAAVDTLTITIKDGSGAVIHTAQLGRQEAGLVSFAWDGSTDAGAAAPDGTYTFTAEAKAGGSKVVADTLSTGLVSSITPGATGASLFVNGVGTIPMAQVRQIF